MVLFNIINNAIIRYLELINPQTNGNIKECYININIVNENEYETLQLNVNESYNIIITNK